MRDFIASQKTGRNVASIQWENKREGKILRDVRGEPQIGTVRDNKVYDLDGNFLGHLQKGRVVGPDGSMPPAFAVLIGEP